MKNSTPSGAPIVRPEKSWSAPIREFLDAPLPERIGWPHIFGSMVFILLVMQFITGILLSFVYAPSPRSAHSSVFYIMQEMEAGAWLRGLHYWGASLIVITAVLHMIRTFLYAAYRRPRQFTWIAGALLLLCILAFGQTGYLLPWDQRAYWGTTVTIQIVSTVPLIGSKLAYLMKGGDAVGALTLSRFYALHVIVLPIVTIALVTLHLVLVRRHGITAPWSSAEETVSKTTPFYPYQMARDSAGMLFILAFLLFLAWVLPAPLDRPADPTDTTFVPRPDWYFLFLFQLLHYFEGPSEILGTFILPSLAVAALLLLPFFDRNPSRRLRDRPLALTALAFAMVTWGWLTYSAVMDGPRGSAEKRPPGILPPRAERIKRPSEVGGMFVLQQRCLNCHSLTVLGDRPPLQTLLRVHFPEGAEWLQQHLQERGSGGSLTQKEQHELMSAARLAAGDSAHLLYRIPPKARLGAHLFYNASCIRCHTIEGQGGKQSKEPGPDLTSRLVRTVNWHIEHIREPRKVVRNSKMPPFLHYEEQEYEALAEYMLYLHTP